MFFALFSDTTKCLAGILDIWESAIKICFLREL